MATNTGPIPKPQRSKKPRRSDGTRKRAPHDKGRSKWQRVRKRYLGKHEMENGWYECVHCGKWTQEPEVDHILKRSVRPDLKYEESNFQILCHLCHLRKDFGMNVV